ncbi:protoheme IX farnesyltransferase [Diplogelasinospora grovesii]|uniref:Protoheme IX farnesyltransferase, mitochondrial n=1 Tax=Diplogelasinospora grovesii TaxID=303347 RepID=A0AAN6S3Q3_9PEZI|nr:protoheme IX farnesyltransferase [Diplogelasinospora grovesii]
MRPLPRPITSTITTTTTTTTTISVLLRSSGSSTENALCRQCTRLLLPAGGIGIGIGIGIGRRQQQHIRPFSKSSLSPATATAASSPSHRFGASYFSANTLLARLNAGGGGGNGNGNGSQEGQPTGMQVDSTESSPNPTLTAAEDAANLLPHRRRQAARRAAAAQQQQQQTQGQELPPDASSILANVAAQQPAHSWRRKMSALLSLSKPRLTVLVVLTAMAPYALYPVPGFLSSSALVGEAPSLSPLTLLFLTTGTTLCSAAANALNMLYEPSTDALMSRTRARPLVRKLISTRSAILFAVGCGVVGTGLLYFGVNPTVSFLGAANIVLYAGVYTPLKAVSAVNTWVGAVVGAIPPLMGWAAAAGETATAGSWRELLLASDGSSIGGWLLAGLLFAWQFPHFMALSWGVREEYKAAGLRMLAWVNPARNARVALRYSLVFIPLCVGLCAAGVTEWTFAVTSLPVNVWLVREAIRFWRYEGRKGSARGLFWASVWHLPVVMVLALLQKKGMWQRVYRSVMGAGEEDDEEDDGEWEDDDEEEGTAAVAVPASTRG